MDNDGLEQRVGQLEHALGVLTELLDERVTTRRIDLVDQHGRRRARLEATETATSLILETRARDDASNGTAAVEVYAHDPLADDGDGAEVGVAIVVDGDVVASWHHLVTPA